MHNSVCLLRYTCWAVMVFGGWWTLSRGPVAVESSRYATRAELELRDGVLMRIGDSRPFDGHLVEDWRPGVRKVDLTVRQGRLQGPALGWYESGQLEVSETFERGFSHGTRLRWWPSGAIKSQAQITHGVMVGIFREWHENGRLARETPLKQGHSDGLVCTWSSSGALASRVAVSPGKVASSK